MTGNPLDYVGLDMVLRDVRSQDKPVTPSRERWTTTTRKTVDCQEGEKQLSRHRLMGKTVCLDLTLL